VRPERRHGDGERPPRDDDDARAQWTVDGYERVVFVAKKLIMAGEEISFNYRFTHYGEAQTCYCGAANCKGTIGLVASDKERASTRASKVERTNAEMEEIEDELVAQAELRSRKDAHKFVRLMATDLPYEKRAVMCDILLVGRRPARH